jgi:hypothetical protein
VATLFDEPDGWGSLPEVTTQREEPLAVLLTRKSARPVGSDQHGRAGLNQAVPRVLVMRPYAAMVWNLDQLCLSLTLIAIISLRRSRGARGSLDLPMISSLE